MKPSKVGGEMFKGFVRQDKDGQYITNGKNCFTDGIEKIRLHNGDEVVIFVIGKEDFGYPDWAKEIYNILKSNFPGLCQ